LTENRARQGLTFLSSHCCISILEKIFNFTVTQYLGSLGEEHKRPDVTTRGLLDTWSRNLEGEFANEPLIEVAVRQTLESRRRVLPDEHPDILESLNDLAVLYKEQGRYEKAEPLLRQAVEGRTERLGPKQPHTLTSIRNLIELYEAWGKPEKAAQWRKKLPPMENPVFQPDFRTISPNQR